MENQNGFTVGKAKIIVTAIIISMLLPGIQGVSGLYVGGSDDLNNNGASIASVEMSDDSQVIISFEIGEISENTLVTEHGSFDTISIENMGLTTDVGKPRLPFLSSMVAVPDTQVNMEIMDMSSHQKDVPLIYPAQEPQWDFQDEPQLDSQDNAETEFSFDEVQYSTDADFPALPLSITDSGKIRAVPFIKLGFSPVQYNPVQGSINIITSMRVRISWDNGHAFSVDSGHHSTYFDDYYESTFLNWESFDDSFMPESTPTGFQSDSQTGCEYLIITHPAFIDAANQLKNWKMDRGIDTWVRDTTVTGTTSTEIQQYIQNAYDTWVPAPSYVLFMGDVEYLPTTYMYVHPSHGFETGTDLWYATVSGADYYPDIFYGRIPVDTALQASTYINKIIDYEIDPPYNSGYYDNITVAAYFQDDENDGYETRRFVRTSEEVRDYLLSQGYDVSRVYCTDSWITPTNYNNGVYGAPSPGAPIPSELLRSNGFAWDGDATDITNQVNNGALILNHRDHGAREGWGDPNFMLAEVAGLNNNELLPIVFSINCQTGWFDHETDASSATTTESFCEEFVRKDPGGTVCIFGATRNSISGYNDYMCRGFYDAIWPNFDLSQGNSTPIYRMGEVLNYGKSYMANTWGDSWGYERLEFELFQCFGDPTMEIWTSEPGTMTVTHAPTYPFGSTQVTVNVSQDNALVCLVQDGEIIGRAYSSGGTAVINVNPMQGGILNVTATKHNFRPYRGNIIVPMGAHDIAVSNLVIPNNGEAGHPVSIEADVMNIGTNNETNIDVQLLVDGSVENSTVIGSLSSGTITHVALSWVPPLEDDYLVGIYAVPLPGENVTWNNIENGTVHVDAEPDIRLTPGGFNFTLEQGVIAHDTLTTDNNGLGILFANITDDVKSFGDPRIGIVTEGGYTRYQTLLQNLGYNWTDVATSIDAAWLVNNVDILIQDDYSGSLMSPAQVSEYQQAYSQGVSFWFSADDISSSTYETGMRDLVGASDFLDTPDTSTITFIREFYPNGYPTDVLGSTLNFGQSDQDYVQPGTCTILDNSNEASIRDVGDSYVLYLGDTISSVSDLTPSGTLGRLMDSYLGMWSNFHSAGCDWLSIEPEYVSLPLSGNVTVQVINETSYITTAGDIGQEVTFYTANASLLDLSLYVFLPGDALYPLQQGADYTVNMTTGEINTIFGGVDQGWQFYTYYNYSDTGNVNTFDHDVIVNTTLLDPGFYRANLTASSNDPTTPEIIIPVNLTVVSAPHDMSIIDMTVGGSEAGKPMWINGTVINQGLNNETNVQVDMLVDLIVDNTTTIPSILSGQQSQVSFEWTPSLAGQYALSLHVNTVSGENITYNNWWNETVNVTAESDIWVNPGNFDFVVEAGNTDNDILTIGNDGLANLDFDIYEDGAYSGNAINVSVLDSYGSDYGQATWDYLNANWNTFGSTEISIDYSTLNIDPITYPDLVASGADVLLISDAWSVGSGWQFSSAELTAISQYVNDGHGLITTSGSLDSTNAPANAPVLAPLHGLNGAETYEWPGSSFTSINLVQPSHPVLNNISSPYIPGTLATATPIGGDWNTPVTSGQVIAQSSSNGAAIIINEMPDYHSVYISNIPEYTPSTDDYRLLYNSMVWSVIGGGDVEWLSENPVTGTVNTFTSSNVTVTVDASALVPGFYQANLTVESNDPDETPVIPVNLTVLSAPHDIAVQSMSVDGQLEASKPLWINGSILNQGLNNETNVQVDLLVDMGNENSTTIPGILSGQMGSVSFEWTPPLAGQYALSLYAIPVSGENITYNNWWNETVNVTAESDIWVNPGSFDFVVEFGNTDTDIMTIGNDGLANLDYDIFDSDTLYSGDINYTISSTPYQWVDGVTGGTPLGLSDDSSASVALPFSFDFYDMSYNTLNVCSNGWASFTQAGGNIPGTIPLPSASWDYTIFALGDDWNPSSGGDVYVKHVTSPERYVITWHNVPHFGSGGINDFELVLYETGNMFLNYRQLQSVDSSWTVGVNMGDGIHGENWPTVPTSGTSLIVEKSATDCLWLTEVPITGAISPSAQTNISVNVNTSALSPGFYQANISIVNNDPDEDPVIVPVNLTVTSAPHDMAVQSINVQGNEAGKPVWVNGSVLNMGTNDETNVQVRLLVNNGLVDSMNIPSILSGQQAPVSFGWTPPTAGQYTLSLYVVPVTGETFTSNNRLDSIVNITAQPDIWVNPSGFDFVVQAGNTDNDILTIGNDGLAPLNYLIGGNDYEGLNITGTATIASVGGTGSDYYAQSFVANDSYVSDAGINFGSGSATPPDMRVQLWGDSGGHPDPGNVISSSQVINGASISSSGQIYYISPGSPVPVTVGQTYWVIIDGYYDHNTSGNCWARFNPANPYSGGHMEYSNDAGASWTIRSTYDFEVIVRYLQGGALADWLTVSPDNGIIAPSGTDQLTITVDTSSLSPGFYQANISIVNNDPDEDPVIVPVNLTVTSAPHDMAVQSINVQGNEAGKPVWVNGSVLNMGTNDETNVQVRLLVNNGLVDSMNIPSILSGQQAPVSFGWTPPTAGQYTLSLYAVPVVGETITSNNRLDSIVNITAQPDIWVNPSGFDFVVGAGNTDSDTLIVGNDGLANLNWSLMGSSGFLETMFAANNGASGNMFDVQVKTSSLTFTTIDVNVGSAVGTSVSFQIYYRSGTYIGHENSSVGWTLVGTGSGISQGTDNPTSIDIPDFTLGTGTYGFFVYSSSGIRYTNGANIFENSEVKITAGCGKGSPAFTGGTYSPRTWNGRLHYDIAGAGAAWLSVNPVSGVVPPSSQSNLNVMVDTAGLSVGLYQANITIVNNDPDEDPVIVPVNLTVTAGGVMELTKEGPATASPGEVIDYWLNYSNVGVDWVQNVVIDENYPGDVTFVSAVPAPSSGNNQWNIGIVPAGSSGSIHITVQVSGSASGTINNTAILTSSDSLGNPLPDIERSLNTIILNPQISITKEARATANPGDEILYWINYTNTGNGIANNMVLTETYPSQVTFLFASVSPSSGNNIWNLGSLGPGASGSITIHVSVNAGASGNLVNSASMEYENAAGFTQPIEAANAITTVSSTGPGTFSINVNGPVTACGGETIQLWINYSNTASTSIQNLVITDYYPSGTTFSGAVPPPDAGNNIWNIGTVLPGASGMIMITLSVNVSTSGQITNLVTADYENSAGSPMPTINRWNNIDIAAPEIEFTMQGRTTANPGEIITYWLNYSNTGLAGLYDVKIYETYPSDAIYLSAVPAPDNGNNQWNLGYLAPGAGGTIRILMQTSSWKTGTIVNSALVEYENSQNVIIGQSNASMSTIIISPLLEITQEVSHTNAAQGDILTYWVNYTNIGNDTAYDVMIVDQYPTPVSFMSSIPAPDFGMNIWNLGNIAPTTSGTIIIRVRVTENIDSTILNSVKLDYDNGAGLAQPSEFAYASTVLNVCNPLMQISMDVSRSAAVNGDSVVYWINYTNTGDADAHDIVISAQYPTGLVFLSAVPAPDMLDNMWNIGIVGPGGSGTITVYMQLYNAPIGGLVNSAVLEYENVSGISRPSVDDAANIMVLDSEPPWSHLVGASAYWITSPGQVINALAEDNDSMISSVDLWYRFSQDNASWGQWVPYETDSTGPIWSWAFSFPEGDGYYEFFSAATDSANCTEPLPMIAEMICAFDSAAPIIIDNTVGNPTTGDNYTIRLNINDNINLMEASIIYWLGNGTGTTVALAPPAQSEYILTLAMPLSSLDSLNYMISATDGAGNSIYTPIRTLQVIDNDVPEPQFDLNSVIHSGDILQLMGTNSTDNICVMNYTWIIDDGHHTVTQYNEYATHEFSVAGHYQVTLMVSDAAGNSQSSTRSITVLKVDDSDGDGIPDERDNDDDNDGYLDEWELQMGTDPTDAADTPDDSDGDGRPDGDEANSMTWMDIDDDNDGVNDANDPYPYDPARPSELNNNNYIPDFWWIIIILLLSIFIILLLVTRKKDSEEELKTEICPVCGFEKEKGTECPFCVPPLNESDLPAPEPEKNSAKAPPPLPPEVQDYSAQPVQPEAAPVPPPSNAVPAPAPVQPKAAPAPPPSNAVPAPAPVQPEAAPVPPPSNAVPAPPIAMDKEVIRNKLDVALVEGRMSEEVYLKNIQALED